MIGIIGAMDEEVAKVKEVSGVSCGDEALENNGGRNGFL